MRKLLLLSGLLFCCSLVFSQQTYTVKVTDSKTGNAIANASATVKSTRKGATTGTDGTCKVVAKENDVLEVTSIGYAPQLVTLTASTNVSVSLQASSVDLGDIVLVGSRSGGRAKTETAVPVDVIRVNEVGLPSAKTDLTTVLNYSAPSFNYNKQSGADGADHIDLGTLRGLGPDQTLVMINGKRRHQTAFVALFGTRGRGNSGTDLNGFPQNSVDRIEILRDGASAQYGSDAIAGVINVILRKNVNQWSINAGWAGYYDTKFNAEKFNEGGQYYSGNKLDGNAFTISANNGFRLGKNGGFVNISLDFRGQGKTYRQADTTDWQNNKDALPGINTLRRAFGDGSVNTFGAFYNMEIPTTASGKTTFYSFGGYNYKSSDAFAYTRNLSARPERFPHHADGSVIFVPGIMKVTSDLADTFYNPHIQTHISDLSNAMGVKGNAGKGWSWDLSNTIGWNDFHYYGDKTFNASITGSTIPNHFDDGGFSFLQNTANLDFSKNINTVASGLNLAFGAECRIENYRIYEGERLSWAIEDQTEIYFPQVDEVRAGAAGSQGFPGFSRSDKINSSRTNFGFYVDAELNATRAWLLDGAVRVENYSDFGFVSTYKLATRIKVASNFNIRGSVSTGFRAPSLQQINFSNTLTSFVNGDLVQSRIFNNKDEVTRLAGIPELKEETSLNGSLGFSWKPVTGLVFTLDGYMVKIKDRVVLSGLFSAFDDNLSQEFRDKLNQLHVETGQFFDNAVNTTNYGIDIILDYTKKIGKGTFKGLIAGNFQSLTIDKIKVPEALSATQLGRKTFFSDREEAFLTSSAPKQKFTLNLDYNMKKFGIGVHLTYFGKVLLKGFGDATDENPNYTGINPQVPSDADGTLVPENFNFKGKITTDVYVSYKFCKNVSLFLGADNLLNVHPNLGVNPLAKGYFGDNESGGPWDSVQMGFNGRRLFAKLAFNF